MTAEPTPPADNPYGPIGVDENAPALVVLRMMRPLITDARVDQNLRQSADVDLRMLNEIQQTLSKNAADPNSVQWLRQLALSWNSKLRGKHALKFRRIFDLLDATGVRRDSVR